MKTICRSFEEVVRIRTMSDRTRFRLELMMPETFGVIAVIPYKSLLHPGPSAL